MVSDAFNIIFYDNLILICFLESTTEFTFIEFKSSKTESVGTQSVKFNKSKIKRINK